ncbi:hypothetical protein [Absidia glauca]|uniref:40S ribosomal protein S7 n=1 Tax=Absidia glauca TaxID=4829 RepID=A0A163MB04_ABSGL|nr:hypothetical protein [Absidia glauca]
MQICRALSMGKKYSEEYKPDDESPQKVRPRQDEQGPIPKYNWNENVKDNAGMIAGDTGITPMIVEITGAKEIELGAGKTAIVSFVPVPQQKVCQKVQQRLTRELEKKFSDRHVVFVAQRRILKKPSRHENPKQPRPRSRTLTAVLEDLVYPTEIVGKRTRVKVDGSKTIKLFLSGIVNTIRLSSYEHARPFLPTQNLDDELAQLRRHATTIDTKTILQQVIDIFGSIEETMVKVHDLQRPLLLAKQCGGQEFRALDAVAVM